MPPDSPPELGNEDRQFLSLLDLAASNATDPDEWQGEPHTLIVHSVTLPEDQFDDGELEYDLQHPPSCKQETYGQGETSYTAYECDVAWHEREESLATSLHYSGTPITEPGTYPIQGWGRKAYYPSAGAYEYDCGVRVMDPGEAA